MRLRALLLFLLPATVAYAGDDPLDSNPRGGDALDRLRKRYKLRIEVRDKAYERATLHGKLRYDAAKPADLKRFAKILAEEFARYPKRFVKRSGLRAIVLCSNLRFKAQKRAALPDRDRWLVIYDVSASPAKPDYVRHVIHHEYFHLVDWVGSSWSWRVPQWKRLNEKGFKYGKGGRTMQHDRTAWSLDTGSKGFLNRYSRSSVSEDMAEIYAFLLMRPEVVADRVKTDAVLESKVRVLKSHLLFFDSSMNKEFWKKGRTPSEKKPPPKQPAKSD